MEFDFWLLLAGIGIFLLGINLMEESIKLLSGNAFKRLIRKYTSTTLRAITTGTFSTAILQSSSAITLMVLAFVGAGVMSMTNAIGVVIGSNLGTTLTSWIIATVGFKFKIEAFALPLVGIGGLGLIFAGSSSKGKYTAKLIAGFGFLFMGLDYMKTSIEQLSSTFDFSFYQDLGIFPYLFIGFVLTAIVQSSSASMAIILTALFGELIDFSAATVMVIGCNLGTTITVLLGSIGGKIIKKQVGLSHFVFNFFTAGMALLLLIPINFLILELFNLGDNLIIALALFHTIFNLLGVLLFAPFIHLLSRLVTKLIKEKKQFYSKYIHKLTDEVPEAGVEALQKESTYLMYLAMIHNLKVFNIDVDLVMNYREIIDGDLYRNNAEKIYRNTKKLQSEIVVFSSGIQKHELTDGEAKKLNKTLHAIYNAVASCKTLKDIQHEFEEMDGSDNKFVSSKYKELRRRVISSYQLFDELLESTTRVVSLPRLIKFINFVDEEERLFMNSLTSAINNREVTNQEISSLIVVNRNFSISLRQLTLAIKDLILDAKSADIYDHMELTEKELKELGQEEVSKKVESDENAYHD